MSMSGGNVDVGLVSRCPPVLAIVLRVLSAYIQASRIFLHQQVTANTGVIAAATSAGDAAKVKTLCVVLIVLIWY